MGVTKELVHENHLKDLPRYLKVNGHPVIARVVSEELARWAGVYARLHAVLHQLEHGEASDFIDDSDGSEAGRIDLVWCREELRQSIKTLSTNNPD